MRLVASFITARGISGSRDFLLKWRADLQTCFLSDSLCFIGVWSIDLWGVGMSAPHIVPPGDYKMLLGSRILSSVYLPQIPEYSWIKISNIPETIHNLNIFLTPHNRSEPRSKPFLIYLPVWLDLSLLSNVSGYTGCSENNTAYHKRQKFFTK